MHYNGMNVISILDRIKYGADHLKNDAAHPFFD